MLVLYPGGGRVLLEHRITADWDKAVQFAEPFREPLWRRPSL